MQSQAQATFVSQASCLNGDPMDDPSRRLTQTPKLDAKSGPRCTQCRISHKGCTWNGKPPDPNNPPVGDCDLCEKRKRQTYSCRPLYYEQDQEYQIIQAKNKEKNEKAISILSRITSSQVTSRSPRFRSPRLTSSTQHRSNTNRPPDAFGEQRLSASEQIWYRAEPSNFSISSPTGSPGGLPMSAFGFVGSSPAPPSSPLNEPSNAEQALWEQLYLNLPEGDDDGDEDANGSGGGDDYRGHGQGDGGSSNKGNGRVDKYPDSETVIREWFRSLHTLIKIKDEHELIIFLAEKYINWLKLQKNPTSNQPPDGVSNRSETSLRKELQKWSNYLNTSGLILPRITEEVAAQLRRGLSLGQEAFAAEKYDLCLLFCLETRHHLPDAGLVDELDAQISTLISEAKDQALIQQYTGTYKPATSYHQLIPLLLEEYNGTPRVPRTRATSIRMNGLYQRLLEPGPLETEAFISPIVHQLGSNTRLHIFAGIRDLRQAERYRRTHLPLDELNHEYLTPMALAAKKGNHLLVRFLIKSGVDPNGRDGFPSPLYLAVKYGRKETALILLKHPELDANQLCCCEGRGEDLSALRRDRGGVDPDPRDRIWARPAREPMARHDRDVREMFELKLSGNAYALAELEAAQEPFV